MLYRFFVPKKPMPNAPKKFAKGTAIIPNRLTLGIDEAGRGPSVGPMVMAAVALDSRTAAVLTRAGLCDSKTYGAGEEAHAIRCDLDRQIRARAKFVTTIEVPHTQIDERVSRGELNVLEREVATLMIEKAQLDLAAIALSIDKIIADGKRMFAPLCQRFERFESHDRAEERHAAVAAASVVAKVIRDDRFNCIKQQYETELGPIMGGGYANAATRRWLRAYVERHGKLPAECRLSWPHPYVIDLIGDVQRQQVGGRHLHGTRGVARPRSVAPENRGATLRRDHRIHGVLEHVDPIADADGERPPAPPFPRDGHEDRDLNTRHLAQIEGDGFRLTPLFRADPRIRPGGVDERENGTAVFLGQPHYHRELLLQRWGV